MIQPVKITLLNRRKHDEMVRDVSEALETLDGTIMHDILHRYAPNAGAICEKEVSIVIDGVTIVGHFDYMDLREGKLIDYKRFKVGKLIYSDWQQEEDQLNIYRYLAMECGLPEIKELEVCAIWKDHSSIKAAIKPESYPQQKFHRHAVDIWVDGAAKRYLTERIKLLKSAMDKGDDQLPLCSERERWATQEKFKVEQEGRVRAHKVEDSYIEAMSWATRKGKVGKDGVLKPGYSINRHPGEDTRCKYGFCSVAQFCNYFKERYAD